MSHETFNIADAKAHLSELVERAAGGETVVLTRRGRPVARLASLNRPRKPVDPRRLGQLTAAMPHQTEDAATLVRRMRDEERY